MTGGYWGDVVDGTPRAMRRRTIENDFIPYVKGVFAKHPALRSAMLTVAQYWADEADDAVHATIVFSERDTPLWPHPCRWDQDEDSETSPAVLRWETEQCSNCGENLGWMPFDDNGEGVIAAFQSCCREDGTQDGTAAESYLPYAIARRAAHEPNEVEVEIVGGPVRAWLDDESARPPPRPRKEDDATAKELFELIYTSRGDDASRQVLADHLQQKGDPLGEYITLSYALASSAKAKDESTAEGAARRNDLRERAARLEGRHGRRWLGPLAKVASAEHVVFDRGFVRAVAVHFANEAIANEVAVAREWGTVQRLRFLPQSIQRLSQTMTSLLFVGPLDAAGLAELRTLAAPEHPRVQLGALLPIERLHVVLADSAMIGALTSLELPRLRCLIVGTAPGGPGTLGTRRARNPFTGQEVDVGYETSEADLSPDVLAALQRAFWWQQLDELVVTSIAPNVVSAWLGYPRSQRPKTISFTAVSPANVTSGFRIRVTEDLAVVDMPSLNATLDAARLCAMLRALPAPVRIELASTRSFTPTDADLSRIAEVVGRAVTRSATAASSVALT